MEPTTAGDESLFAALRQAETDLAFALAQGNAPAEDEAAKRIAELKKEIERREEWDAVHDNSIPGIIPGFFQDGIG